MDALTEKQIPSSYGEKRIAVYNSDIRKLDEPLDIMTISAFYNSYEPTPNTLLHALAEHGISISVLAESPAIDLRKTNRIWLSDIIDSSNLPIKRIGCVELSPYRLDRGLWQEHKSDIISSIRAYFHMLHIASLSNFSIETVGIPIFGGGSQQIDAELITTPTLNECFNFLKSNELIKKIDIISVNARQAFQFAEGLEKSYSMLQEEIKQKSLESKKVEQHVFISYSSTDKNIADNLCSKLETHGIKVWYAPRDVKYVHSNDYATSIVNAISRSTHFVVIISSNSLKSEHVLNEIDLAFHELPRGIKLLPLRIDEERMGPSFRYYLSRQHWMDAHIPPLEKRLDEFIDVCFGNR